MDQITTRFIQDTLGTDLWLSQNVLHANQRSWLEFKFKLSSELDKISSYYYYHSTPLGFNVFHLEYLVDVCKFD